MLIEIIMWVHLKVILYKDKIGINIKVISWKLVSIMRESNITTPFQNI